MRGIYEKVPGSGVWWIRFAVSTGTIRREKAGTKSAAKQLYALRKADVLRGAKLPFTLRKKRVTFGDLAKVALEYSASHKRSSYSDTIRMKHLVELFGAMPVDSIKPKDVDRLLKKTAAERGWKPATRNRYHALISLTFRIGLENGQVDTNPARYVRRTREDNHVIRYLTDDEEKRLRAVLEARDPLQWAAVRFALNTGLRAGEQKGLRWSDLVEEGSNAHVILPLTKNGGSRAVQLNSEARAAIEAMRACAGDRTHVFHLGRYRDWFHAALKEAGIENFTWHCQRHCFASKLTMVGVDLRTTAELLGHRSLAMTVRYSHLSPGHNLSAVEKIVSKPTDTTTDTGVLVMAAGGGPKLMQNIEKQ